MCSADKLNKQGDSKRGTNQKLTKSIQELTWKYMKSETLQVTDDIFFSIHVALIICNMFLHIEIINCIEFFNL